MEALSREKSMFFNLINFDVRTLIGILFWGNLTSAMLIFSYQSVRKSGYEKEYVKLLYYSRFIKSIYYLLTFFRGTIPDIISANLGNTLLYISLYMDGYLMLKLSRITSKKLYRMLKVILIGSVIIFNSIDIIFNNPDLRVVVTSALMFATLIMPSVVLLYKKNNSKFTKIVGLYYIALLIILLPRISYSLAIETVHIFTNNIFQSLTFISLTLIMIFSAPAFLLIMKENSDIIIEKMATTDSLTNIPNRQSFLETAGIYFERHKNSGQKVALLFFDIDYFKKVNDTYGHSFGDEVLVKFAGIIKNNMRHGDISCRYGGEEFVALLMHGDENIAFSIGERIMKEIENLRFDLFPEFRFTVSIGICADVIKEEDTPESFISKADKALYEAKNTGRNKIVAYSSVLHLS